MIPILSLSLPPVALEGACGSAMAERTTISDGRVEETGFAATIIGDNEALRAAAAASVARCGIANTPEARGADDTLESIDVVARAGEA